MLFRRKTLLFTAILLLGGAAVWWQQNYLLGWHYFRQLHRADEQSRDGWIQKLADLDRGAQPHAIRALQGTDPAHCADGEAVLLALGKRWQDERTTVLMENLLENWGDFSGSGRNIALNVARHLLDEQPKASVKLAHSAAELLKYAVQDARTRRAVLKLAASLEKSAPEEIGRELLDQLATKGLAADDAEVRALTMYLFLYAPLSQDAKLLAQALPHLRDSASQVRRAALLAFGPNRDLLADDDLLPLLHDADGEVRRLCEMALRSRGLDDDHILLARLISDERPAARLEVLRHLGEVRDLEPGVWLRRLCQDPSAAVRAAAVRAAAGQTRVDLTDQLRDLAQNDASPTVRQIAGYYVGRAALTASARE